jgi:hypothetical protein
MSARRVGPPLTTPFRMSPRIGGAVSPPIPAHDPEKPTDTREFD